MIPTPSHEAIHEELRTLPPGHPRERELLNKARDLNHDMEQTTDEHKRNTLQDLAGPERVITKDEARFAGQIAVEHVTEEHRIPVHIEEHPVQEHKVPQIN